MNTNRPLLPGFLKKADKYLLLNKPETWSARTHLVAYYGLLFIAFLTAISFIIPDDARSDSSMFAWVGFTIVISIIALIIWLIFLFRFNVFKRFGKTKPIDRLATFGLYFLAIGIFFLFPFVKPAVETMRANNAYSDTELVNDVNAINIKICQLEYDSLYHNWTRDTVILSERIRPYMNRNADGTYTAPDTTTIPGYSLIKYEILDSLDFQQKKAEADSVEKVTDSLFVLIKCPEYIFLKSYKLKDYSKNIYGNYDIYKLVIKNYQRPNKTLVRKELMALIDKYKYHEENTYLYQDQRTKARIQSIYSISDIGDSVDNIVRRKDYWSARNMQVMIRMFFYFTLAFTLLVFVFRHSTKKVFFLSLLTGVLLTILTSLILAFSSPIDFVAMVVTAVYILSFFVLSSLAWRNGKQQMVTGISLNLFVLFVAFLPICILSGLYSYADFHSGYQEALDYDFNVREMHYLYAEIGGIVLLLLLLPTYIHEAYRKWYALPEQ